MDLDLHERLTSYLPTKILHALPQFEMYYRERLGFSTKYISNGQMLVDGHLQSDEASSSCIYDDYGINWYVLNGIYYVNKVRKLLTFKVSKIVSDAIHTIFLDANGRLIRNDRDEISNKRYLHAISGPGFIIALDYERRLYQIDVMKLKAPVLLVDYLPPPVYFCNQPRTRVVIMSPAGTYLINKEGCKYNSTCFPDQVLNFINNTSPDIIINRN